MFRGEEKKLKCAARKMFSGEYKDLKDVFCTVPQFRDLIQTDVNAEAVRVTGSANPLVTDELKQEVYVGVCDPNAVETATPQN
ncbi:hypothetical protein BZM27_09410 [Paraburkholderia steynii]|uniref:Uncharacterized protein n=1 Tax=Paraburkholderia steynii TaxID=1245441 RepID=A0A4V2NHH4_9BURK|nr:hypothetical protein BZM27_09410 [Paraburkholderia steynii]